MFRGVLFQIKPQGDAGEKKGVSLRGFEWESGRKRSVLRTISFCEANARFWRN